MLSKRYSVVVVLMLAVMMLMLNGCIASDPSPVVKPTTSSVPAATKDANPNTTGIPAASGTINDGREDEIKESTPDEPIVLSIPSVEAKVGEQFSLFVSVGNDVGWTWSSFEFRINCDPTMFKILEIKPTEYTKDMIPMSQIEEDMTSAKVAYITAEDMIGGGEILEIVCEAVGEGTYNLELSEIFMYRVVTYVQSGKISSLEIPLDPQMGTVTVVA